jgi:hypothetical protein
VRARSPSGDDPHWRQSDFEAYIADGVITVRITDQQAQPDGRADAAAVIGAMRR